MRDMIRTGLAAQSILPDYHHHPGTHRDPRAVLNGPFFRLSRSSMKYAKAESKPPKMNSMEK